MGEQHGLSIEQVEHDAPHPGRLHRVLHARQAARHGEPKLDLQPGAFRGLLVYHPRKPGRENPAERRLHIGAPQPCRPVQELRLWSEVVPALTGLYPNATAGGPDASFLAPDCFHFNTELHSMVGKNLWNNMVEPGDSRSSTYNVNQL